MTGIDKEGAYGLVFREAHGHPWDGEVGYRRGMTVTHNGKTYEAWEGGVYNAAIEPGRSVGRYWIEK